jgi:hypothetical protein
MSFIMLIVLVLKTPEWMSIDGLATQIDEDGIQPKPFDSGDTMSFIPCQTMQSSNGPGECRLLILFYCNIICRHYCSIAV